MLRRWICAALLMALLCGCAGARAEWTDDYAAADSAAYDVALALETLGWNCLAYDLTAQKRLMDEAGFTRVGVHNYTRTPQSAGHTCAYTVYQKPLDDGRTLVAVVIRGTGQDEWALNIDLMPSGDYDLNYAENFYLAAKEALDTQEAFIQSLARPVFFVTGHSRGAACANVLAKLLTDRFGAENVYAYTFATPRTVRGEYPVYGNIFNIVNPEDFVTFVPLPQWGFARYGVDVPLPTDTADAQAQARAAQAYAAFMGGRGSFGLPFLRFGAGAAPVAAFINAMAELAPTVRQTYTIPHSLTGPGFLPPGDTGGLTAGNFILSVFEKLLGGRVSADFLLELAAMKANRTDFDPLLNVLMGMLTGGEALAIASAHIPATYAAWLIALNPQP